MDGRRAPAGYDSEFTSRNATSTAWNVMHMAQMLRERGGFPAGGSVAKTWREGGNAADQDPDAL